MKYFAVFLEPADQKKAQEYHQAHVDYVKQLCKEEKIVLVGKLHGAGGLIIYQAESEEALVAWLKQDPFIQQGARTYTIYEWDMHTAAEYIEK